MKAMLNYAHYRKIFFASALAAVALGASIYWFKSSCEGIVPYSIQRDKDAMIALFKDNWYWLVPENTNFSMERFLTKSVHYSPSAPSDRDISKIMVYCYEGKLIGFVAYDKESFYKGRIRFIVIDKKYRGQGYSEKLMDFAMRDLKNMGSTIVHLLTRTDNQAAQKFYERIGFNKYWQDDGFVKFEKALN